MRLLLIPIAALALGAPASAQDHRADRRVDPLERDIVRALPPAEEIEAMAPALDRALSALLSVDVGPILDAADPARRRYDHGRPGRTLGRIGSHGDPRFEERMRGSVYRSTEDIARMSGAFAAAAPSLARSLRDLQAALAAANADYHRRGPARDWDRDVDHDVDRDLDRDLDRDRDPDRDYDSDRDDDVDVDRDADLDRDRGPEDDRGPDR